MSHQDVEDVVNEAVARVAAKWQGDTFRSDLNPAVYLLRTAEHTAIDHLRRTGRETTVPNDALPDVILTDDEAAAVFEHTATALLVRQALADVFESGDVTLFRIATYMLDEIQRTGSVPSNRSTAKACGLSHTAVANALVRLRAYFHKAHTQ